MENRKQQKPTTPEQEEIELHPDAWEQARTRNLGCEAANRARADVVAAGDAAQWLAPVTALDRLALPARGELGLAAKTFARSPSLAPVPRRCGRGSDRARTRPARRAGSASNAVCGCRVGACIAERTEAGFLPGARQKPGAGGAGAVFFYLPSMLLSGYVPVPGDAELGAGAWRGAAVDALCSRRAGGLIEGPRWFHRRPRDMADRILRARGRSGRACRLPPPSRLTTSMSRDRRAH